MGTGRRVTARRRGVCARATCGLRPARLARGLRLARLCLNGRSEQIRYMLNPVKDGQMGIYVQCGWVTGSGVAGSQYTLLI